MKFKPKPTIDREANENELKKIDETEVELETLFQQLQDVERDTMNSLTEKYGNVELDLKTGEIKAKS